MRRRALKAILISAAITAAAFLFVAAPAWQDRLADPSWPKMALPLLFILAPYAYLALLEKLAWSKSLHDPAAKPRRIFANDYALVRKFDFIEVASALTCISGALVYILWALHMRTPRPSGGGASLAGLIFVFTPLLQGAGLILLSLIWLASSSLAKLIQRNR